MWYFTLMRASTTSSNPLQHAVTRACTAIWGRIRSDPMSSSESLTRPWQLASNKASSQAGWEAPALSQISRISRWPSLTAAVVAKPLKSFWFTSAPILCHFDKLQPSVKKRFVKRHASHSFFYLLNILTQVKKETKGSSSSMVSILDSS